MAAVSAFLALLYCSPRHVFPNLPMLFVHLCERINWFIDWLIDWLTAQSCYVRQYTFQQKFSEVSVDLDTRPDSL